MKEAIIVFLIALVIGSIANGLQLLDVWGVNSTASTSAANMIPTVNDANFDDIVVTGSKNDSPVLVDFYSDGVADCNAMVPVLTDLTNELHGAVKIVRMDATECPMTPERFGVGQVPDQLLFVKGEKVDHLQGARGKEEMLAFIKKYVDVSKPAAAPEQQPVAPGLNQQQLQKNPSSIQG